MDKNTANLLSQRLLDRVTSNTTDEAEQTMTEPASVFIDRQRWQQERDKLFLQTPQVIGFAAEVAKPGSFITADILDIPVVVTRDENSTLRAFINACAHRGARVANGCGEKKRLTCSYHGWSYALDGTLAGRPWDSAFESAGPECNLTALPVSDNGGLLMVGLQADMPQSTVDHALDELLPELSGFNFTGGAPIETRRFEVKANWKLVVNLSHESYHFAALHRDSLAPFMKANAIVDTFGRHSRWGFPMSDIEQQLDKPQSEWPDRPPAVFNHTVFPGTVIVVGPQDAQMIRAEPGDTPDTCVIHYSGLCENPDNLSNSQKAYEFGGEIFGNEDLTAAIQCQQGLAAGQPSVIFGRNEPLVQFWHNVWNEGLK